MRYSVCLLMGLPGSGKSTFVRKFDESKKRVISMDDYIVDGRYEDFEDILHNIYRYYYFDTYSYTANARNETHIIDGLILTNDQAITVIKKFGEFINTHSVNKENVFDITIHYWKKNRNYCLANDYGRREQSSEHTILNAPFEEVDIDKIRKGIGDELKVDFNPIVYHEVKRATTYDKYFEPLGEVITSEQWTTGGHWGDCWGNEGTIRSEEPCRFYQFDNLLEQLCPNITFLQYKNIESKLVHLQEKTDCGYYGSYTYYSYWSCDTKALYDELLSRGLISEYDYEIND